MFPNINFDTSLAPTPVTFSIPRRLRGDTVYGMSLWGKNFLKCNIKTLFVCSIFGFVYTLGCIMFRLRFSKLPILEIFLQKFHGLVLGLVEVIDAMGIDVAQPIWL